MRTVFLLLMIFILSSCESSQPIQDEQKRLIDQEITASNTFKIVKNSFGIPMNLKSVFYNQFNNQ